MVASLKVGVFLTLNPTSEDYLSILLLDVHFKE